MEMNITVIASSPHRNGSSRLLADKFAEGATAAGHDVYVFDGSLENVAPCKACGGCAQTHKCVQFDPFMILASRIEKADMIVFVTPIYYFDMCAQLKCIVDRLHMFDKDTLWGKRMGVITTSHSGVEVTEPVMKTFDMICSWFTWKNVASLNATGVESREQFEQTDWPQRAYDMGFNL